MPNKTDFSTELLPNNSDLNQIILTVITKYYYAQFSKSILINTDFSGIYHQIISTFSVFISNYTIIFRESLPNKDKHFFQTLYQTILTYSELLQNNTIYFFQNSLQTILTISESFYKTMVHAFPEFISTNYWKYQKILIFSEFMSTNIDIFTKLLP